ncbi:HAMP domain-containing sensor histidine kinase [Microbacterium betulae]|uniref:histidine kinase n=1 Tax=Microbacterium betulae TaxID=2981139 RepID=A0AA97FJ28_9MICO|nr:HAMP domain-containing sensor histidine kinase [Microbacterium sp. AB]WOF23878.1 HAMP domain-containing sensor histidine kinase [Microbacterium sp. AB]
MTRWWRRISLRAKVTGVTVFVLAAGLLTAGLVTLPILRSNLSINVDNAVLEYAESNVAERLLTPYTTATGDLRFAPTDNAPRTEYYVAIYDREGSLVATAGGTGDEDVPPAFPAEMTLDKAYIQQNNVLALDSATGAGAGFHAAVSVNTLQAASYDLPYATIIALPLSDVDEFARTYVGVFTLVAFATVLVAAFLTRGVVTLTFRRFGQVEATAMEIAAGDFSQRMTDIEPRTEIGRLKIAINTMLDRIDGAIDERDATVRQMRRFIGDASHELRTPLVSVRGYAELYRMGALQGDEATAKAMERIEAEAKRMGVLVEDLLALTRLDDRRELDIRPVDLRPIAHDAALDVRAADPARDIRVVDHTFRAITEPVTLPERAVFETSDRGEPDATPDEQAEADAPRRRRGGTPSAIARASAATRSVLRRRRTGQTDEQPVVAQLDIPVQLPSKPVALPPVVRGEEDKIRQVVSNLLGNARRYSPEDSPIFIEVGVDARTQRGWIAIVDHGEGVAESIRDKVFQRFWRADSSRARDTGGSGLGLSIVASIVDSLSGTVEVFDTPGGGATFQVAFPLARERSDTSETATPRAQPPETAVSPEPAVDSDADDS